MRLTAREAWARGGARVLDCYTGEDVSDECLAVDTGRGWADMCTRSDNGALHLDPSGEFPTKRRFGVFNVKFNEVPA